MKQGCHGPPSFSHARQKVENATCAAFLLFSLNLEGGNVEELQLETSETSWGLDGAFGRFPRLPAHLASFVP